MPAPAEAGRDRGVPVWDPVVRAGHWLLAAGVAVAAGTGFLLGARWVAVHLAAGVAVAFLVWLRLVWGFLGPTHARFADFRFGPRGVLAHLRGHGGRHLGHNPAGALMVFALLLVAAALAATGPAALGGVLRQGPLAALLGHAAGRNWLEVHEALAIVLLGLVALHLGGVAFESRRTGENLVAAMVTGRKPGRPEPVASTPVPARPRAAAALVSAGALAVGGTCLLLARLDIPGLPPTELDPTYARECGECHTAYAPSLAPASVWAETMAGLERHFGEDASLDPATAQAIAAYLAGHAAESADTLPAHAFRVRDPAQPLRITATPFWRRAHAEIADAAFASGAVRGRGNCAACHRDTATGMFAPQEIALPEDPR